MFKHTISMIGLLFLTSCASVVTTETKFTTDSDKGIVIFGFGCNYTRISCGVNISKLKIDGSMDRFSQTIATENVYTIFSDTAKDNRNGEIIYNSYVAEPGEYGFVHFHTSTHSGSQKTILFKDDKFLMKFKVEPGKINYIGDLLIQAKIFPAKILNYKHDINSARKYLDGYTKINGKIQENKIEGMILSNF